MIIVVNVERLERVLVLLVMAKEVGVVVVSVNVDVVLGVEVAELQLVTRVLHMLLAVTVVVVGEWSVTVIVTVDSAKQAVRKQAMVRRALRSIVAVAVEAQSELCVMG